MGATKIKLMSYKNCQLRAMYGMGDKPKQWKKSMDKIKHIVGEPDGQWYDINQVVKIFSLMDIPDELLVDELEEKCKKVREHLKAS